MNRYWIICSVLVCSVVLACLSAEAAGARLGEHAPDFTARSLDGGDFRLSRSLGAKATVVGLFHICEPCRRQMVHLQEVSDRFGGKGVVVIGVNIAGDDAASVRSFLEGSPIPIRFLYAVDQDKRIGKMYNVRGTPTVYVLDRGGTIRFVGSSVSAESLASRLIPLIRP
jgi:cytochrome c biogenesis protein CcmG, thiol:disulfide interchange protein DsbE